MKLAVRKEEGRIIGGGFHYMLHPMKMENDAQARIFEMMGHIIIEVDDERGQELIKQAGAALFHQCEVAVLADHAETGNLRQEPIDPLVAEDVETVILKAGIDEILIRLAHDYTLKFGRRPKGFALGPQEYLSLCYFVEHRGAYLTEIKPPKYPVSIGYPDTFCGMVIELKSDAGISVLIENKIDVFRHLLPKDKGYEW